MVDDQHDLERGHALVGQARRRRRRCRPSGPACRRRRRRRPRRGAEALRQPRGAAHRAAAQTQGRDPPCSACSRTASSRCPAGSARATCAGGRSDRSRSTALHGARRSTRDLPVALCRQRTPVRPFRTLTPGSPDRGVRPIRLRRPVTRPRPRPRAAAPSCPTHAARRRSGSGWSPGDSSVHAAGSQGVGCREYHDIAVTYGEQVTASKACWRYSARWASVTGSRYAGRRVL